MPWISMRDGRHIHVRVIGRGEPCVLVHGFGMQSRSWLPFIAPLLVRHRFILPDLRGFGPSHPVPLNRSCALTNYAEDVEDVLDALDVRNVPVAAISMGASTALQWFRLFGGTRCSRYLHIDQSPAIHNDHEFEHGLLGEEQAAFFARFRALIARTDRYRDASYYDLPSSIRKELWSVFTDFASFAFTPAPVRAFIRCVGQSEMLMRRAMPVERWQTYIDILRAYFEQDYDMRETAARIRVPVTVLVGSASRMYPPEGQRTLARLLPNARIVELPDTGHYVPFEAPVGFLRELGRFLGSA